MLKLTVYNYWRDANNNQHTCFYKIIHFSVQFLLWKHNLIVLLQIIEKKENNNFRKMFIVADLVSFISR